MKLRVIEGERFSCGSCTNCCRDWHVELTEREIATLPNLVWPAGDELAGKDVLYRHAGRVFLAHRRDASCVYLNPLNGLCRVHEVFGESVKPFGCRLYPFVLNPTFPGDTRVGARFDCPNVRDNAGLPHADHLPELRRLERELAPPETTGDRAFSGLAFDQAQAVVEFLSTFLAAFPTDEGKALFLYKMSSALASVAPSEISREGLAAVFGPLKSKVETAVAFDIGPASALARAAFRALLAQYLRRDEDILNGFASRGGRLLAMSRVVLGGGTLRGLGRHHPTIGIGRPRGLTTRFPSDPGAFNVCWRLVRAKLESFQFMGSAKGGHGFMEGLRSLALIYPLVRSYARVVAAERGSPVISSADAGLGVSAIDHSFGRSAALRQGNARSLESLALAPATFPSLARYA